MTATEATATNAPPGRCAAQLVVAEAVSIATGRDMPDWVRFEANSRSGWVTLELSTLDDLTVWADALGHGQEPDRDLYPAEGLVRYNSRWSDPVSAWRYDLNCKVVWPLSMPLTDDVVDAAEIVLTGTPAGVTS